MANGDIFYSRLSFGTIQQQFFWIFQFLKGGSFSSPPGTQGEKKTLVLKGLNILLVLLGFFSEYKHFLALQQNNENLKF